MTEALTPGEFAKALQEKREAQRRRKLWRGGALGAAVVLVALAVYLAFFSSVFAVKQVSVAGAGLLTVDEVKAAAQVPLGQPLLTQDLGGVRQRIEDLPAVRSAEVERQFPDVVAVTIEERAVAFLRERDGEFDWIDPEGVSFHRTADPLPQQLVADVAVVEDEQRLLADVATVATAVPPEVRAQVVAIQAEAVDRISLLLDEGRTVVWGSADESPLKAEVIAALISVEAETYDVSAPGHPTTR